MMSRNRVSLCRSAAISYAVLIFTFTFLAHLCDAQITTTYTKHRPTTDTIEHLILVADEKVRNAPQEAVVLATEAKKFSDAIKYTEGQAKSAYTLGKAYYMLSKGDESLHFFALAAKLFSTLSDHTNEGLAYNGTGNVYLQRLGNRVKALEYYQKAHHLLQHDSTLLVRVLINLGTIYSQTTRYDEALELYKKVYSVSTRNNDLPTAGKALHNIAYLFQRKQDFKTSIEYNLKSLHVQEIIQDYYHLTFGYSNLGLAYNSVGRHEEAEATLLKGLELARSHKYFDLEVDILLNLCRLYDDQQNFADAEKSILRAEEIANRYNIRHRDVDIFRQFSIHYKLTGKAAEALHYHEKYSRHNDSIINLERNSVIDLKKGGPGNAGNTGGPYDIALATIFISLLTVPLIIYLFTLARAKKHASGLQNSRDPLRAQGSEQTNKSAIDHVEVVNGQGLMMIPLEGIWWFQKEGRNYTVYTEKKHYRLKDSMSDIEQLLPVRKFYRINRTTIINVAFVENYSFWQNHKYILRMTDANRSEFVISRNRLKEMKETFRIAHRN